MHGEVRPGPLCPDRRERPHTGTGNTPLAYSTRYSTRSLLRKGPGKGTGPRLEHGFTDFVKQSAGAYQDFTARKATGRRSRCTCRRGTGAALVFRGRPGIGRRKGGHETILVVEDDKLVRDFVLTQLHSLGYVTRERGQLARKRSPSPKPGMNLILLFTDVIIAGRHERPPACRWKLQRAGPALKVAVLPRATPKMRSFITGRLDFRNPAAARQAISQVRIWL